jgi:DNA-directed RNA polymerase subunit RPC12/RpoP
MIAKNYPSDAITGQIWGNPATRMLKTYSKQTDQQIDNKLLEHMGVKAALNTESVLRDISCPNCGEPNRALADRCIRCGEALSEKAKKEANTIGQLIREALSKDPSILIDTLREEPDLLKKLK